MCLGATCSAFNEYKVNQPENGMPGIETSFTTCIVYLKSTVLNEFVDIFLTITLHLSANRIIQRIITNGNIVVFKLIK